MNLEAACCELERTVREGKDDPNPEARLHRARRLIIASGVAALNIEHANGLSLGDVIQWAAHAAPTPERRSFAALVIQALSTVDLIPSGSTRSDLDRNVCTLVETAIPEVLNRFRYPFKAQTYEKRRALEGLHSSIVQLLSPLSSPPLDLVALLAARTRLTRCLTDSAVEIYFGSNSVRELFDGVNRTFEALSDLKNQDDPAFHARLRIAQDAATLLGEALAGHSGAVAEAVAGFKTSVDAVITRLIDETAPRLVSEISTVRTEPRVAAKKYQLHEEGRELSVAIPLLNKGPGWAYDVAVLGVATSDSITLDAQTLELGDVRPGEFTVALQVLVCSSCREATVLLDVSWRTASSPERLTRTFAVNLEAQRADVDWQDLEARDPYSLTVAEGDRFVGRAARVRNISSRFTRETMESVLIDGQKRVGKSSLALAIRDAVIEQTDGNIRVIYREFGDYGSADASDTLSALGRTIAEDMLLVMPPDEPRPQLDFRGTLSPLSQLARILQARCPSNRFLIILDEFDEIHPELYQHGRLADVFFQNMRTFSGQKNIGVMLVGGERLRYILSRQGDQLNRFSLERLSYFSRSSEAEDYASLIQAPSQPNINWDLACVTQLYDLTNGHPYFTKLVCREAYRAAVTARDTEITPTEVIAATASLMGSLDLHHFAHFWMDGILAEPEVALSTELDRRRLLVAAARARRAGDAITVDTLRRHKDPLLESEKVSLFLNEFVKREILVEDRGEYRFTLQLFEDWLVNAGVTKLIPEQSAQEQAAQARRAEDEAYVTSTEIHKLVSVWPIYRGQVIGAEHVRAWLAQVDSNIEQRLLFKLLQRLRFVSEKEIREKLQLAHGMVRQVAGAYTPKSRAERRYDLVVTYIDGEGKSGQFYASKYAEENLVSTRCVIGQADFANRMDELEKQHGRINGIVIVDDIIGTGNTLKKHLAEFLAKNPVVQERKIPVVVVVLLATSAGEDFLRKAIAGGIGANVDLRVCEHIDDSLTAFGETKPIWASEAEADRARGLVQTLGRRIYRSNPLGYGDMGLLVVFPNTVPNNTLPILHSSAKGSEAWEPLFLRPIN